MFWTNTLAQRGPSGWSALEEPGLCHQTNLVSKDGSATIEPRENWHLYVSFLIRKTWSCDLKRSTCKWARSVICGKVVHPSRVWKWGLECAPRNKGHVMMSLVTGETATLLCTLFTFHLGKEDNKGIYTKGLLRELSEMIQAKCLESHSRSYCHHHFLFFLISIFIS